MVENEISMSKNFKSKGLIMIILTTILIYSLFIIFDSVIVAAPKMPKENEECLDCHNDKTLKGTKRGKTISVYVNPLNHLKSVHAENKCVDCHVDVNGEDLPHDNDLKPAKCDKCHIKQQEDFNISLHGRAYKKGDPLAPTCQYCHGSHQIEPANSPNSPVSSLKIPYLCGRCHREGSPVQLQRNIPQSHIIENYTESIHGEGLFKKGLTVTATCISCHTSHAILPHTDKRSSIARNNIASTCTKCHGKIEEVHKKVIKGELWEKEAHVLPACVDCHQPHKARKTFYEEGLANKECLNCHQNTNIKASKDGRSLFIDIIKLNNSVHSEIACSQCHIQARPSKNRSCESITEKVNCGGCHDKVKDNYVQSGHGIARNKGNLDAPTCTNCHGEHDISKKSNPQSKIFKINIPKLCSECHQDGKKAAIILKDRDGISNIVKNYTESVHGQKLSASGLTVTATCSDCHTPHLEINHKISSSSTSKKNIATTCGQCHWGVSEEFNKSIHSPYISKSKDELPTCNNCHIAHSVANPKDDAFRMSIMTTCGKCHEKISDLYFETYHGKASLLGSSKAAKCSDCHGSHNILPANNINSTLSRVKIVKTCSKCHPKANLGFTRYLAHATHHDPDKYPLLYITFWGMSLLLIGTFIISWIHTLLWLPKSLKMRKEIKALREAGKLHSKRVMRFNLLSRILHVVMIISFLTLASTGMLLKYSHTVWSQYLTKIFISIEIAGFIHRVAAVFLFGVFFTHIYDLIFNKRKEYNSWKEMLFGPDTMLPNKKDLQDVVGTFKWFINKGQRPNYGRWTYWEKFDYFAVFWGVFVIGFTGLSLWFPHFITKIIPGDLLNVFTIIHSDEALLASGFIFTIHFFNTHFRPEKFPMDTVIFSGSYELEEFKIDRPDEYQRLLEEGKLEELFVEEPDTTIKKIFSIFGWVALSIGLILVFLIVYSILSSFI